MSPQPPNPDQTIHVVDDDEALRDSLLWMLESHGYHATGYPSAAAFLAAHHSGMRGCLVLDVRMPGMTGLELFEALRQRHSTLPVIFVTGHGDVPMAVLALKKGASDFIEKPFNDQEMLTLIQRCLTQERESRSRLAQDAEVARRLAQLTDREREVLDLIVAGRLNKQIADDLDISIKTVEVHRARLMEKMGVRTLAELVRTVVGRADIPRASGA